MESDSDSGMEEKARPATLAPSNIPGWRVWLETVLGATGVALLLMGAGCFLAWNWRTMPTTWRFGLVEAGFALCVLLGAVARRRRPFVCDLLMLAAAVMAGGLWIVFSQIYQTGADAWNLFALWLVCATPWLLLRPTLPLWTLWLTLGNIALWLWSAQTHPGPNPFLSFQLANAALWAFCLIVEISAEKKQNKELRLNAERFGLVAQPFALGGATYAICYYLVESLWHDGGSISPLTPLTGMLVLAAVGVRAWLTRRAAPLFMLGLCGFPLINCLLLHAVSEEDIGLILFLYTAANLGYTALILHWLAELRHHPEKDPEQSSTVSESARRAGRVLAHILAGLGGFLSAVFLIALTVWLLFDSFFSYRQSSFVPLMLLAAAFYLALGAFLARHGSTFRRTLSLALSLAGLTFLTVGLLEQTGFIMTGLILLPMIAVLYVLLPRPEWRFLSLSYGLILFLASLGMLNTEPPLAADLLFQAALLLCALPLFGMALYAKAPKFLTAQRANTLIPALYASVIALALYFPGFYKGVFTLALYVAGWSPGYEAYWDHPLMGRSIWFGLYRLIVGFGLFLLLLREGWTLKKQAERSTEWLVPVLILAAGLFAVLWFATPDISLALLLLGLGHARGIKGLTRLGAVFLVLSLVGYYYSLHVPFLTKAQMMGVTGLVLLAGAFAASLWKYMGRKRHEPEKREVTVPASSLVSLWSGVALLCLALTLGAFQYAVRGKAVLLAEGKELLLALAPVDPRSLVQGDYMVLDYMLVDEVHNWGHDHDTAPPRQGFVVVRLYGSSPAGPAIAWLSDVRETLGVLEPDEYPIPFTTAEYSRIRLALPDSFLFQEGQGELYANARFGLFRCMPKAGCVLVGLTDEEGHTLVPPAVPKVDSPED